jgi:hypothetical protein
MPLFLKNKLLLIHIPKCGGSTITEGLRASGDSPFLFVADGSIMINGHTPQHMTWCEFKKAGWTSPPGYKVAALVRHPVARVLSAYRYIHAVRKDLLPFANSPSEFLDHFLRDSVESNLRFDNHNKSLKSFLQNEEGEIDPEIHVQPIENIETWLEELNLPEKIANIRINSTRENLGYGTFSDNLIQTIRDFYEDDVFWFEQTFPQFIKKNSNGI